MEVAAFFLILIELLLPNLFIYHGGALKPLLVRNIDLA